MFATLLESIRDLIPIVVVEVVGIVSFTELAELAELAELVMGGMRDRWERERGC